MTLLSVNKQCLVEESQTSTQVQASIVGRFDICTDEKARRGSILIRDLTTIDSLICRVDKFHHDLVGMAVCISTWNYIYHQNASWLEVYLDDVFPLGSNTAQSILQQSIHAEQIANELLPTLDLWSITDLLCCPSEQVVHVAGRIVSKPVSSGAQFVIELASLHGEASALVVFQGDTRWYHTFVVGTCHVFVYVKTASVTIEEEPVRGVLAFIPGQSRTYQMSERQIQQLPAPSIETTDERLPPAIPRPVETTSMASYKGMVTRVIDPVFGVYELDHQLVTCLFNYTDYALMYPYRQGMQLHISGAHMLAVDIGSAIMRTYRAPTVERGDTQAHVILVGCLRTHVQIVGFPTHTDLELPDTRYGPLFSECVRIRADFDTLIQKLEMYAAITGKFSQSLSKQQIRKISRSNEKPSKPFGDMYGDIFHHQQACSAVKTRANTAQLKRYPCVSDMTQLLLEARQLPSHYAGSTASSREDMRVEVFLASFDETKDDMIMMGIVDSMSDGRLYFMDDSGKIPLVLLPQQNQRFHRGDMYRLRRFRLVREDLDYQEEHGEKVMLDCVYILCDTNDMQRVAKIKSAQQQSIALPATLDTQRVAGFKRPRDTKSLSVLQVLRVQPTTVTTQLDKTFELDAHVQAIRYPVIDDDNTSSTTPDEVHLILNSKTQSMQYLPQLRAGCWIGIVTDNKESTVSVDHSKYLPRNIRMPKQLPQSLVVDRQHTILTTNPTEKAIRLTPIDGSSVAAVTPPRIHQVTDLFKLSKDENAGVQIGNKMFHETVNVQGVIVSKGFREHHERALATIDTNARQIFEQYGVGTGQQGRNQLFFRVRQTDGLDTVDIYMDVWKQRYPLGMIPGSLVTFYNVVRRATDLGVRCQALACTSAEVSEVHDPRAETILTEQIPRKRLADITRASDPMVFKFDCTIKYISSVTLSWQCTHCGTALSNGKCYRQCKMAPRLFTAHAIATLFDGTGQARAYFDGDRLVFGLLNMNEAQIDKIKAMALDHGTLSYNPWDHHQQDELSGHCRRVAGQVLMVYARARDRMTKKDATIFEQLRIYAKSKDAVVLPECPKIVAVQIERLDPAACAWDLIVQMDSLCSKREQ
ncbi:CST, telomere maintenance, complex subunit CTC1-domain-containing protein [Fennellomyces sp. T-0311]|nr:CST, telomere maintenance, complex subunit CTC1-domain-containing protein [Fennellomyces sp. T-0311]